MGVITHYIVYAMHNLMPTAESTARVMTHYSSLDSTEN